MTDVLEFNDITAEIKGAMCPGRLKLSENNISFKNQRTGKVEQLSSADLELCNWQKLVGNWGIRLFLKNGSLHRFCGFKESELDKIAKFFKNKYQQDLLEKELSVRGWNWGTAKFSGSVLSFDVHNLTAFEIPLSNVSQCTTGKNEVTVEFHQNDEAPVSLMEIRFHIPSNEIAGDDPVDAFHSQVMQKASVISVSGDAVAIFREIHCLTPRGRYDIKIFSSFFQLHGKTFDYKIPMATVLRLFVLPHKDGRQHFFVVSLDPPIKQGQTRYHYLVFLFGQDDDMSLELPFSEEELSEKYEGKLTKELSGPTYDVLSRIMKVLVNRKITFPSGFIGHSGTAAVGCSYKAAAGYMYPLERGFIYIHKPPLHIRFEEISSVNFARSGGSTRSFDFEIELKSGVIHTFSSIEKEEYGKLFDFITSKKLHVKNKKSDKPTYAMDDFRDSDEEKEPDAYLARVKREGQERDDEDGGSSDESTDEDFKPQAEESDVAEEYDTNPTPTDSDDDSDASGGGNEDGEKKEKKEKKEKREKKKKKTTTISEKPRKKREKKHRDADKPKRAPSAYMLWFNDSREKIKADNPGISFTDIAKKGGELWKNLSDKSEWEKKAAKLKEEYTQAMSEYKASGKANKSKEEKEKSSKKKSSTKSKPSLPSSPDKKGFISKEFIEDSDSSSDSDADKKIANIGILTTTHNKPA
ncbi:FACT complex subunit Ssrp1 isoform X2 [Cimex lectularius]|uniref:FACT complex subunit SSRP1 n=1 Tax=Cimex lectularius TaxID=79782 RepID=A0A8I6RFQ7_CIMLE|nr:FACT complex subunit Ssrp1 isoform X2 [Cimex lectularius]